MTVEKKEGKYRRDKDVTFTDLPGIYSLSPYTPEEIVTRDYLMSDAPDAVINIIDATNIERNLYLTTQILDLGLPTVVALNVMDLVRKNGDKIDVDQLSRQLGCLIVEISALRNDGVDKLVDAALQASREGVVPDCQLSFAPEVEAAFGRDRGDDQAARPARYDTLERHKAVRRRAADHRCAGHPCRRPREDRRCARAGRSRHGRRRRVHRHQRALRGAHRPMRQVRQPQAARG